MSLSPGYVETTADPVTVLQYRDIGLTPHSGGGQTDPRNSGSGDESNSSEGDKASQIDLNARIAQERAEAAREAEERAGMVYEQRLTAAKAPIAAAIADFAEKRNEYYARVESEVVQLALAIAKKILHREAQVDPMLVATLVRMAIEKLRDGSSVKIRVSPAKVASWKTYFAGQGAAARAEVVADASLSDQDCFLETELGSANFGLDTQLKEVEQGFFDLLALRPVSR